MPSIRERNGSYQITVSVGRDFEGRQLFERCTFHPTESTPAKIRKEVEAFAISFEKRAKEGKYLDAEKITYRDFAEIWFKDWHRKT